MQNNRGGRYNEDGENISCFFACVHKSVSFQTDLFVPSFQDWRSNYSRSSPSNLPVCAASNSWPFSKKAPGERNLGDATLRDETRRGAIPLGPVQLSAPACGNKVRNGILSFSQCGAM